MSKHVLIPLIPYALIASVLCIKNACLLRASVPLESPRVQNFQRKLLKRDFEPDKFSKPRGSLSRYTMKEVLSAYEHSAKVLSCPISTYECGNTDPGSDFKVKSLGMCAVVASGRQILNYQYGLEIDSFDTVVRIGYGPVQRFKKYVGARTDVIFVRSTMDSIRSMNAKRTIISDYTNLPFSSGDHLPTKFFLTLPASCQLSDFKGKSILKLKLLSHLECNRVSDCGHSENRFKLWYSNFAPQDSFSNATEAFLRPLKGFRRESKVNSKKYDKIMFTHGFELILALLYSKLCTSITTYGFSKYPSYHYFDKGHSGRRVRPGHVMGMEYYILEILQKNGHPIVLKAYQ